MSISASDFESVLRSAVAEAADERCPPLLAAALEYAVFPGGARVRPKLCVAVALANRGDAPTLAAAAAASVELLHCASLVHDDLPCFDNAPERRGKPSVHARFGEPIALLAGDALIVSAFALLARPELPARERLPQLLRVVAEGVGSPCGIAAGQAWESEPRVDVPLYHRAKTGALFIAATAAGAAAALVVLLTFALQPGFLFEAGRPGRQMTEEPAVPEAVLEERGARDYAEALPEALF